MVPLASSPAGSACCPTMAKRRVPGVGWPTREGTQGSYVWLSCGVPEGRDRLLRVIDHTEVEAAKERSTGLYARLQETSSICYNITTAAAQT